MGSSNSLAGPGPHGGRRSVIGPLCTTAATAPHHRSVTRAYASVRPHSAVSIQRSNFQPTSGRSPTREKPHERCSASLASFGRAITASTWCTPSARSRASSSSYSCAAEALPARRVVQVDRDLAGAGVRRPRAVRRGVGVAHHLAGGGVGDEQVVTRLVAGQPSLPVAQPGGVEVERRDRVPHLFVVDGRDSWEVGRICAAHGHGFHDDVPMIGVQHRARHQGLDLGPRRPLPRVRLRRPGPRPHRSRPAAARRRVGLGSGAAPAERDQAARREDLVAAGVRLPRPRRAPPLRRAPGPDARAGRADLRQLGPGRHRRRGALRPPGPRGRRPRAGGGGRGGRSAVRRDPRRPRRDLGPPRAARQRQRVHRRLDRPLPPPRRAAPHPRRPRHRRSSHRGGVRRRRCVVQRRELGDERRGPRRARLASRCRRGGSVGARDR